MDTGELKIEVEVMDTELKMEVEVIDTELKTEVGVMNAELKTEVEAMDTGKLKIEVEASLVVYCLDSLCLISYRVHSCSSFALITYS